MPVDKKQGRPYKHDRSAASKDTRKNTSNKCFSKQLISRIPQANTDKYIDKAKKNKRKQQIISSLFLIHH